MKTKFTEADKKLIDKNKIFIKELTKVEDMYFETLCSEIGLNYVGNDLMFDFIYNDHEDLSFEEYMEKYYQKEGEIFEDE